MENAMRLAGPEMKMFNISAKVGIPDPNYFGRCFKKYTGKSYSDYAASATPAAPTPSFPMDVPDEPSSASEKE